MVHLLITSFRSTQVDHTWSQNNLFWIAANLLQATWSVVFSIDQIELSALVLVGVAASLFFMLYNFMPTTTTVTDYILLTMPLLIHTGWIVAATLLNINMLALGLPANWQFGFAWVSITAILAAGMFPSISLQGHRRWSAMNVSLLWALYAISVNLSDAIADTPGAFVPAIWKDLQPIQQTRLFAAARGLCVFVGLVTFMNGVLPRNRNREVVVDGDKYVAHI